MNTASLLPPHSELDSSHDPLLAATLGLERSARLLDLEDWVLERLRHCEQETVTNFLLAEENGQIHSVTGIYARHCSAMGRAAVPFQVSREAYRNSVCAEAIHASWLCALYGVPFGGGAAALIVDAQKHSERELHKAITAFGRCLGEVLGSAALVTPSGVHGIQMDWFEAGLKQSSSQHPAVTGKASSGSSGEMEFALGMAELIRCSEGGLRQRIAVQGFDENVRELLSYLHRRGARIVAVADASGGVRHDLGLDPRQLDEHVRHHGVLLGYPEGEAVLNADVLEDYCDVLILAGGDRQVHPQNAPLLKARVVMEVTAGAVMHAAKEQLAQDGKLLVPTLVCAGPGLLRAVAESEQVGSMSRRMAWMRRKIRETWKEVAEAAARWDVHFDIAAHAVAVQRVAAVLRAQGNPG